MTKRTHMWNPIRMDHRSMRLQPIGQNKVLTYEDKLARNAALPATPVDGMVVGITSSQRLAIYLDGVWVDEDGTVRAFESVEDDEEKQELMFAQRLLLNSDAIKEYGHLIESITETAKGGISIKLVSKQAAIKMLGDFQQTWRPQEEDPKTPGGLDPHMEVFPDDPNDPRYDELLDALE